MTPGGIARKVLGKRGFHFAGYYYRRFFVDLATVAVEVAAHVPPRAYVLDIGGGDGAPLNYLLALRSDIRVTMIDLAATIGGAIEEQHHPRVTRLPRTSVRDFLEGGHAMPDAVLISDVLHHVPPPNRPAFFADLHELATKAGGLNVIVKDVEPTGLRAGLGYLADRWITGDKTVSMLSRAELGQIVAREFSGASLQETPVYDKDAPNYVVVFAAR